MAPAPQNSQIHLNAFSFWQTVVEKQQLRPLFCEGKESDPNLLWIGVFFACGFYARSEEGCGCLGIYRRTVGLAAFLYPKDPV